jgi:RNA polymerase sigma-70 factor (ECF subfamily)
MRAREPARVECDEWLERHRAELTGFCRRMLGPSEAEDAVQETLLRAWRNFDSFEGRSSLRSWLCSIATNVCLDMREARRRRAWPIDLGPAAEPHMEVSSGSATSHFMRDGQVLAEAGPEESVIARESERLALVALLEHLSPKQRAVLILRTILRFQASEVAVLLGTSVPSVNSALQRARARLQTTGTALPGVAQD